MNIKSKDRLKRIVCFFLAINLVFEIISPTVAMALTSGPSQQEFSSFEPSSTTDMVDLSTGDFTYNIPLMSVPGPNGGYPINIAYHSGIGMEQEASWVGLGWSLNVGSVNRQLRGIPDDFKGDKVKKTQHMKETWMVALDIPKNAYREVGGFPPPSISNLIGSSSHIQVYYNNYKGLGYRYSQNFSFPNKGIGEYASVGLNASFDSQNGIDMEPKLSLHAAHGSASWGAGVELGLSYNSMQGVTKYNFSYYLKRNHTHKFKDQSGNELGSTTVAYQGRSSISYGVNMNVPKVNIPTKVTTVPFNLKIAKPSDMKFPLNFKAKFPLLWSGYVTKNKLENGGVSELESYGYMNNNIDLTTVSNYDKVLRDFQRNDIPYSKKVPNLASSAVTYDIFNQTGQGTGSMFRGYQNQISVLYDPKITGTESSYDTEVEFGVGPGVPALTNPLNMHVGLAFNYGYGENKSGSWEQIGSATDVGTALATLSLSTNQPTSNLYEKSYFKVYGEKTGFYSKSADDQLSDYLGDKAIRFKIEKTSTDNTFLNRHYVLRDDLVEYEGQGGFLPNIGTNNTRNQTKRERRANNIEYFNVGEAANFGYSANTTYEVSGVQTSKFATTRPSHHLSEVSMLQPDGMRYVYGIPVYNNKQVDNVFTVKNSSSSNTFNTNTVSITPGGIEGIDILGTQEEYMSRNEMPEYSNSFLLTYIFSADYVDLTNNGPTDDDYGYWMKFNYEKVHSDYKWRAPYAGANFIEGFKSSTHDDKGSYSYGEKEIFIIKSIESKTHIAKFITSNRADGIESGSEVSNSGPGTGGKKMKKLDKIVLYSKKDLVTPIKAVNFVYSYELCLGTLNNAGASDVTNAHYDQNGNAGSTTINQGSGGKYGKLTLKQVYFTYKNSTRSQLSPYIFNYTNPNPDYERRNMDRWGNYANNTGNYPGGPSNNYPWIDFPYTQQDNAWQLTPAAWTLSQIILPTGGVMNIEYENDDYRYVERERALRMFDIVGIGSSPNTNSTRIATNIFTANADEHRIWFKLEKPYSGAVSAPANLARFMEEYVTPLPKGQIYFKVSARMYNYNLDPDIYDYVTGYGEVDAPNCGLGAPNGSNLIEYGYIQMQKVGLSKNNVSGTQVNPIVKSTIEHMRLNRSELLYNSVPNSSSTQAQIANLLSATFSVWSQIKSAVVGFNNYMYNDRYNKNFDIRMNGRSIIRLCDPDEKVGGGIRVKSLAINDNWTNGTTSDQSNYGQSYEYKTTDEKGNVISSGVAYEPQVGYEECALRTAIKYANSSWTASDYPTFVETPIAIEHYPGESVIYSKVTVRSIGSEQAKSASSNANILKSNAAPITVYEFYTGKDFPVIFRQTDNGPYAKPIYIPIPILGLFSNMKRRHAKSQGYSVVLNDMAGKQKQITTYTAKNSLAGSNLLSEPDKVISMKKFIYNTVNPYNPVAINELNNKVQAISVDGSFNTVYQTAILGQSHDMYADMNENSQFHDAYGGTGNLDIALFLTPLPTPLVFPWILPSVHKTTNSMRTVVFNKIIHRTGILMKTETTTDQSTITEENLAFDIETGNAVLSKVTNEFKDPIYNFNYPGHWYYRNLAGAYKNQGMKYQTGSSIVSAASNIPVTNASAYFTKGDLVYINAGANSGLYHVFSLATNNIQCVKAYGANEGVYFPGSVNISSIQVVKSGYKNLQNTNVGTLAFKSLKYTSGTPDFVAYNPSVSSTEINTPTSITVDNATSNKIINSSAVEFTDNWQMACASDPGVVGSPGGANCPPNAGAIDLMNFLSNMAAAGKLFSLNEVVFTNPSVASFPYGGPYAGTYNYGFTQNIILNSPDLQWNLGFVNTLYYVGAVSSVDNSFNFMITRITPTSNNQIITNCTTFRICMYKFPLPAGVTTSDYYAFWTQYFSSSINLPNASTSTSGLLTSSNTDGYGVLQTTMSNIGCNNINPCPNYYSCPTGNAPGPISSCGNNVGGIINPYIHGMKGIWRPKYSYAFNTSRSQNNNIREDGVFSAYARFPWENPSTKDAKWIKSNTITKYNPEGFEVENVNPIGNFSSALYGYENAMVTAVASNARYTDIAFDGFEDYPRACVQDHFSFSNYAANVVSTEAHTGKYSMEIVEGLSTLKKVFTNCDMYTVNGTPYVNDNAGQITTSGGQNVAHVVKPCDCIGKFAPQVAKKYIVSAWVKEKLVSSVTKPLDTYTGAQVQVACYSGSTLLSNIVFSPSGNIIDGWQRVYGEFTIPGGTTDVRVSVSYAPTASTNGAYVDDIRLMPFDGNMKTFVYDAKSLKVLAELDENNYATMYNYDDEGNLTKVKKETEQGVKTIKEGRINSYKVKN